VGDEDFMLWGYSQYLNLSTLSVWADFDGDFDVDDDDLAVIDANANMSGATWVDGDLNGDGTVDAQDLALAFAQFGLALDVAA
jgi:hypothetical protein